MLNASSRCPGQDPCKPVQTTSDRTSLKSKPLEALTGEEASELEHLWEELGRRRVEQGREEGKLEDESGPERSGPAIPRVATLNPPHPPRRQPGAARITRGGTKLGKGRAHIEAVLGENNRFRRAIKDLREERKERQALELLRMLR